MKYAIATIGYKSATNIQKAVEEAFIYSTVKPTEFVVVINPYEFNLSETERILSYVKADPRVTRWAYMSQNVGCAKAFNIGFKLCEEELIVALSDDCRVGPLTYGKMISGFSSNGFDNPLIGIVGVEAGGKSEDAVTTAKGFLLAYRKSMIDKIGGYDEVASPLGDEREFGLRAAVSGYQTKIVTGCEWHHIHDISNHPTDKINYFGKIMSPKGENPFQDRTEGILQTKINEHNRKLFTS